MHLGKPVFGDLKNEMHQGTDKYRDFEKRGMNTQLSNNKTS
jgi:hypothetical protein